MNIMVDIGHPAHVHIFRNLIKDLKKNGHTVVVTVKTIASAKQLLNIYGIPFIELGAKSDSISGKMLHQLKYDWEVLKIVRKYKIQFAIGTSITIAHVSKISSMRSFVFDDDDSSVQPLMAKFGHPFADHLISPDVLKYERKKYKHITYAGFHELAYLHPNRFKPDPSVLDDAGIKPGEKFFILRFNAFKAHHDIGVQGLSIENKKHLIERLLKVGKVFITTERNIDSEFEQFKLKVSPEKAHSLLYFATMLIGDSQTMTSEAAVLGTPAIRSNSLVGKISYLEQEEHKYGLTYGFLPDQSDEMFKKIDELLNLDDLKGEWQKRREKLLADKIDVTSFFIWFLENYPKSFKIMKSNPDHQYKFR